MSNDLSDARLRLKEAIDNHNRGPAKKLNEDLQQTGDSREALQNRISDLEGKIKALSAEHASVVQALKDRTRQTQVELDAANKTTIVLKRNIDVLQKSSAEKDATIVDLNKQLSWVKAEISKKPEEPKPQPKAKFRRSKSSRIPGLKPGAGPAAGS